MSPAAWEGISPIAVGPGGEIEEAQRVRQLAAREPGEDALHRRHAGLHVEQSAHVVLGEDQNAHENTSVRWSRSAGERVIVSRLEGRRQVAGVAGADHDRRQLGLGERPGEREPGHRDSSIGGLALERLERVEDPVGGVADVRLGAQRHPRSGGRRLAAAVLPGEPPAGERAERGVAEAMLAADREDGLAITLLEEREAVLHPLVARQPFQPRELERLCELLAAEVGGTDRADLACGDQAGERLERLLLGRVGVEGVREVERHALDAEPAQARVDLPLDPSPPEAVILSLVHRVEGLRRDHDPVAHIRAFRREPLADEGLAAPAAVGVGGVVRRDAAVPRRVEQPERVRLRGSLAEERRRRADPAEVATAEDDPRDRGAAAAQESLVHPADPTAAPSDAAWFGSVRFEPTTSTRGGVSRCHTLPAATATTRCATTAAAAAGSRCPRSRSGSGTTSGAPRPLETGRAIVRRAFDLGVTHFDLANNYGPPYGSAEENFGRIMRDDLRPYRDELVISTKAGYDMWPGPYGDGGSRKYLLASLDQSLGRLGLDYVDIFYSHRVDPSTPLEETMGALDSAVRQGKALYAGISSYSAEKTREAHAILRDLGTPLLIHQPSYSILNRWIEPDLVETLGELGVGCITFSPLAQGVLTDRYLHGIPEGSRASRNESLAPETLTEDGARQGARAQRDRGGARPVARPDGACLDAARFSDHLDPPRCQ